MATDLKRAYQISKRAAALAEHEGLEDDPLRVYATADEVWAIAEKAFDAEQRGEVQPYHFIVIQDWDSYGFRGYRAIEPDDRIPGCDHWVHGSHLRLAKAAAVAEHRQLHVGE